MFCIICPKSEDQESPSALGVGIFGHSGRENFETIAKT